MVHIEVLVACSSNLDSLLAVWAFQGALVTELLRISVIELNL